MSGIQPPRPSDYILAILARLKAHRRQPREMVAGFHVAILPDEVAGELLVDPVVSTLRGAIRDWGWIAFTGGGMPEMHRVFRDVEDKAGGDPSWETAVVESCWDGIGGWTL